jgi:hypothetical protein
MSVAPPRAVLVNQVVTVARVEITLLSYVVVDHTLRVHGALRMMDERDALLASVPVLELTRVTDASPLRSLGAHVKPQPPTVWLAWTFELPEAGPVELAARIEQLHLGFRTGTRTTCAVGPWVFPSIGSPALDDPQRRSTTDLP